MSEQRKISASQQATMESEYQPNLFLLQYEFRRAGTECLYKGRISNEGHDLAQEISVRSILFVDIKNDATEYRISDYQLTSSNPVTPLSEVEFVNDVSFYPLLSDEDKDSEVTIEAPFYIKDIPSRVSYFRTRQDRDMQPYAVSFLKPGESTDIDGKLSYTIQREQATKGVPLEFPKVLEILRRRGFDEVHIWIGLEYLDGLGNKQSLTLHTRTLKLRRHYVDTPIEEWGRCNIAKELNEMQSTDPRHYYILDKQ